MKKFAFPLQKLLDYRSQLLEHQRAVLGQMNAVLSRLEEDRLQMTAELGQRAQEHRELLEKGTTPREITMRSGYSKALEQRIERKQAQIALQKKAIDKQMEKVRAARQELSVMEKLREKKWEEYAYQAAKAEEAFIEEFVNNTSGR